MTSQEILEIVCQEHNLSQEMLKSKCRKEILVYARQRYMYLSEKLTKDTHKEIAKIINRCHSTVCHSIRCVQDRTEIYDENIILEQILVKIKQKIKINNQFNLNQ